MEEREEGGREGGGKEGERVKGDSEEGEWRKEEGIYRRSGFNCEYLLNANCEDFKTSQLIDSQK